MVVLVEVVVEVETDVVVDTEVIVVVTVVDEDETVVEEVVVVVIGFVYSRTRKLLVSATQRFPFRSNATPTGNFSPLCDAFPVLLVNVDCPITTEANSPLESGDVNSSTRLLKESATQRFPPPSKLMNCSSCNLLCPKPLVPLVKLGWPITVEADSPLERGALNSRILLLLTSDTQRLSEESKASPAGEFILLAEVPAPELV